MTYISCVKGKFECLLILVALLAGCASSDVSRDAASNIDLGVRNAKRMASGFEDSSIADSYQNSSQAAKGALIGGTGGAITGALTSIGFLPGTVTGAILGASYGAYIDANTTLEDRLINRGVNVIVLGDQILLVLPSSRIFSDWTPRIKPQAYSTLNLVTEFINRYTKMLVRVSGYTDNTGSLSSEIALSQQQANSVAKYLEANRVDARLLYATGCGGTNLVEPISGDWESQNYRIEITLEKLYV